MTKCDFCTRSDCKGNCTVVIEAFREDYCKKAIRLMIQALGNGRSENGT